MNALVERLVPDEGDILSLPAVALEWLTKAGWDATSLVLRPNPSHETLGWRACSVAGCLTPCWGSRAHVLCGTCLTRWRAQENLSFDEFIVIPRLMSQDTCKLVVDGERCERPVRTDGFCSTHAGASRAPRKTARKSGLRPLPSLGECTVVACDLMASQSEQMLCRSHYQAWRSHARGGANDIDRWRRSEPSVRNNTALVLRGLPNQLIAEVLLGIFARNERGSSTRLEWIQRGVDWMRREQIQTLLDLPNTKTLPVYASRILDDFAKTAQTAGLDITDFRHADIWPGVVFGRQGDLNFTHVSLPWLQDVARDWAWQVLHKFDDFRSIKRHVDSVAVLSAYLRSYGPDRGWNPRILDHDVILAFVEHLHALARRGLRTSDHPSAGQWTVGGVRLTLNHLRTVLRHGRDTGLVEGLPQGFAIADAMVPKRPKDLDENDENYGRSLPLDVMRQLISDEYLKRLNVIWRPDASRFFLVAAETGRRPIEVTSLKFECLDTTSRGGPYLIYRETKVTRGRMKRLRIPSALVPVIRAQQEFVRTKWPDTPSAELALFPRVIRNPHGKMPLAPDTPKSYIREWVDSLPALKTRSLVNGEGMVDWPRERVFLYALRHTYAQVRADAGVPIEVLQKLMDHEQIGTTRGYFVVKQDRLGQAQALVGSLFVDDDGVTRSRGMTADELLQRQQDVVNVAHNGCDEPHNVAAGGFDCPLQWGCLGCSHRVTDPSYLPAMRQQLEDLLVRRARVDAFEGAEEWAKEKARPGDKEIELLRSDIALMEEMLATAPDGLRADISDASSALRRERTVGLTLRVGPGGRDALKSPEDAVNDAALFDTLLGD